MSTISDVARAAGVSVATVSRALRGLDRVSPQTQDRVVRVAAELNYVASPTATSLASGRTLLVGIITPFVARWFFAGIMSSIEKTLRDRGYRILLTDLEEKTVDSRLSLTQGLLFKRVDGLILINVDLDEPERELVARLSLPVVSVGYRHPDSPWVGIDDIAAAVIATEHVIELGHREIAYVGKVRPHTPHGRTPFDRLSGFRTTMERHGLRVREDWVIESEWNVTDAYESAKAFLAPAGRPTAVVAGSDEMAMGVMGAARYLGLSVPGDVSIVGIDDHEIADVFGLTTVRQDVAGQGVAAANALLAELGADVLTPPRDQRFEIELIRRSSTAAPAVSG